MLFFRKKILAASSPFVPPTAPVRVPMVNEWIQLTEAQRLALAPLEVLLPPKVEGPETEEPLEPSEGPSWGQIIPFHIHQARQHPPEAEKIFRRVAGGPRGACHPIV